MDTLLRLKLGVPKISSPVLVFFWTGRARPESPILGFFREESNVGRLHIPVEDFVFVGVCQAVTHYSGSRLLTILLARRTHTPAEYSYSLS